MLSLHFNTQVFINALKANKNMVTYLSTTIALMVIMIIHGLIQGNLKAEYFIYAIMVSFAFCLWALVDQKFRKATQSID